MVVVLTDGYVWVGWTMGHGDNVSMTSSAPGHNSPTMRIFMNWTPATITAGEAWIMMRENLLNSESRL